MFWRSRYLHMSFKERKKNNNFFKLGYLDLSCKDTPGFNKEKHLFLLKLQNLSIKFSEFESLLGLTLLALM